MVSSSKATQPLALVHTDLWGPTHPLLPLQVPSIFYYLLMISLVLPLDIFLTIKKFKSFPFSFSLVENQFDLKIKCLQLGNGGEFKTLTPFLTKHGIYVLTPILLNRMVELSEKFHISLKLGWPNLPLHIYLSNFGIMSSKQPSFLSTVCLLLFLVISLLTNCFFIRTKMTIPFEYLVASAMPI